MHHHRYRKLILSIIAYVIFLVIGDGLRLVRIVGDKKSSWIFVVPPQLLFGYGFGGVMELSLATRNFKRLHSQLLSETPVNERRSLLSRRVAVLEQRLYPWLIKYKSLRQLKDSYKGRGIVIPVGGPYIQYALTLVENLRLLNCTLPVIAYYNDEYDLSPKDRGLLKAVGVESVNLQTLLNDPVIQIASYAGKTFAILASPFREVIMAEADVVFLQNPELLFDEPSYKAKRQLFFRDKTVQPGDKRLFFRALVPRPLSEGVLKSRFYSKTNHEQEAGVILYDKVDRFYSLVTTCKLNSFIPRGFIYFESLGDKESYWLAAEIMQEPYAFNDPHRPGLAGYRTWRITYPFDDVLCGRAMHAASNGAPFWLNGGVINKGGNWSDVPDYQGWAFEGEWVDDMQCLRLPARTIKPLNDTAASLLHQLGQFWLAKIANNTYFTRHRP